MRQFDRWLGIPACFLLTIVRRITDLLAPPPSNRPRRILFIKLSEQGATVLAGSAIKKAVDMVGRENVFFLVFDRNRFILEVMGQIPPENIVSISSSDILSMVIDSFRAVRQIRHQAIDAAIDMEFFARSSAVLSWLSGSTRRVGFHAFASEASYRGDLMTHRLSYNSHLHISQIFDMMVESLNTDPDQLPAFNMLPAAVDNDRFRFNASAEELAEARSMLSKYTNDSGPFPLMLLNANCSDILPLRRWPEDNYVELSRRLLDRYPALYIAFTGDPSEASYATRLARQVGSPRCFSLAGRTTLRQLLTVYTLAKILVTNDSGPAQFATLTPLEVITLFGPETPAIFGARTPRNHVFCAGLVCSPCVNAYNDRLSACRNNLCMQRITVEDVFQKACELYEKTDT